MNEKEIKAVKKDVDERLFKEFFELNFKTKGGQLDKDWSVYWAEPQEIFRVITEHYISMGDEPEKRQIVILDGLGHDFPLRDKRYGETKFTFTNTRHREVPFWDERKATEAAKIIYNKPLQSRLISLNITTQIKVAANLILSGDIDWNKVYEAKLFNKEWWTKVDQEIDNFKRNMS